MRITNIRINGIENPMGFIYEKIICSWNVTKANSQNQTNVAIEISDSKSFTNIVYKKEGANLCQSGEILDIKLQPRKIYYYRIMVKGEGGENAISDICCFETGKMGETWDANWIAPREGDDFHPVMVKKFPAGKIERNYQPIDFEPTRSEDIGYKNVKRARLYLSGVGLFEAYINGQKAGEEYLTPYINDYEETIQVMTYSLDGCLKAGENKLEILLGKGWYMGTFGLEMQKENYGNRMAVIAEVHIEYEDGSRECIGTDESWQYYGSDIEDSGIYLGEIYNRLLWEGKENPWKVAVVFPQLGKAFPQVGKRQLMDRISLPVLVKENILAREIIHTPADELVLDFGQNFAGFVEFRADLPKGTKVVLDYGEILQKGCFYNKNYRDAKSQFRYISGGEKETVRPHFTFFGFRYVRVSGWVGICKKEDFMGKVLYSDIRRTGTVMTGHKKINRLYENTIWGLKSNFIDMPTDCPQRSERLGWTGDAQVFAATANYHMDTRAFFHKFIFDLKTEQKKLDGGVPNYLPNIGHKSDVGSVWGDIAAFLPYTLYTYYGNLEEMEYCYPLMKGWVDYIDRKDAGRGEKHYLFDFGFHFGDWLALDGSLPTSYKGGTQDDYIASMYYYRSTQIVRQTAEYLQKQEDVLYYRSQEEKIKQAIFQEFFTPSGRLAIDTQTAYVIALKFGVHINYNKLIGQFKKRLKKDCNQIKCGFVGAPLLCTVLAEAGLYETAYDFLLKEGFPSWLYSVNLGATTIWERWNSVLPDGTISDTGMNSLNHYAYGSVMEFVYSHAAGIRPLEPGFKKAVIAPHPDVRLKTLKCSYDSANGLYVCNWSIEKDGHLYVHVEIPFHCEAVVELPGYPDKKQILKAGSYDFDYVPEQDFRKPYCENTTLSRLAQDVNAMEILEKYIPAIASMAALGDPEMGANTLKDISSMGYLPFEPEQLKTAIAEICNLIERE